MSENTVKRRKGRKRGPYGEVQIPMSISHSPAEAGGYRVFVSKICKIKGLSRGTYKRPIIYSEWFNTEAQAKRKFKSIARRC